TQFCCKRRRNAACQMDIESRSRPMGPQVQEEGQPLPSTAGTRCRGVVWNARLAQRHNHPTSIFKSAQLDFERPMFAMECHRDAIALDRLRIVERSQIVSLDNERRVGL